MDPRKVGVRIQMDGNEDVILVEAAAEEEPWKVKK